MKKQNLVYVGCLCLALSAFLAACRPRVITSSAPVVTLEAQVVSPVHGEVGFRTRRNLEEHYEKHGREFDSLSPAEYLRAAQTLRAAVAGGDILEAKRSDGVTTRFDRKTGAFLAFNEDFTIRTFFKPNDGERYFKRQLKRSS